MKNNEKHLLSKHLFYQNSGNEKLNLVFDTIGMSTNVIHNINYGLHHHLHYEIVLVLAGTIHHKIEGESETETLSIGDVRMILPYEKHSLYCSNSSIHRDILISKEFFQELSKLVNLSEKINFSNTKLTIEELNEFNKKFQLFTQETNPVSKKLLSINILSSLILKAVYHENSLHYQPNNYPDIVNRLLNFFDRPLYLQLTLKDIIDHENYSPIYVANLFKKHVGITPTQYLKEVRLKHICYYLTNTSYTLQRICSLVGLDNLSYMHKIFKERFGMSPTKYRNKNSNTSQEQN